MGGLISDQSTVQIITLIVQYIYVHQSSKFNATDAHEQPNSILSILSGNISVKTFTMTTGFFSLLVL